MFAGTNAAHHGSSTTAKTKQQEQQELEEQVRSFLLFFDRKVAGEYRTALERVPYVVNTESRISEFLRKEGGDPMRAAKRIALYWKVRKQWFGEDRWLRPMNQTGTGCLNREDISLLRTGFLAFVSVGFLEETLGIQVDPKHKHLVVILIDRSRLHGPVNTEDMNESIARIIIYSMTVFESTRYIIMQVAHRNCIGDVWNFDPEKSALLDAVTRGDRQGAFVVRAYETPEKRQYVDRFARDSLENLSRTLQDMSISYVAEESSKATREALVAQGVPRVALPRCLGGRYDYKFYDDWIRSRLSIEDCMGAAHPVSNSELANFTQSLIPPLFQPNSPHDHTLFEQRPGERPEEFNRRRNLEYSRRFQQRRRQKEADLLDQRSWLRIHNEELEKDNERLENTLAAAKSMVEAYINGAHVDDVALDLVMVTENNEKPSSTTAPLIGDEEILRMVLAQSSTEPLQLPPYDSTVHNLGNNRLQNGKKR